MFRERQWRAWLAAGWLVIIRALDSPGWRGEERRGEEEYKHNICVVLCTRTDGLTDCLASSLKHWQSTTPEMQPAQIESFSEPRGGGALCSESSGWADWVHQCCVVQFKMTIIVIRRLESCSLLGELIGNNR